MENRIARVYPTVCSGVLIKGHWFSESEPNSLSAQNTIHFDHFTLTAHHNELISGQIATRLEHKQTQLLLYLISRAGENVSKTQMLDQVWKDRVVGEEVLSVAVSNIRKALRDDARSPRYIKTIPGSGYCFIYRIDEAEKRSASRLLGTETAAPTEDKTKLVSRSKAVVRSRLFGSFMVIVIALLLLFFGLPQIEPEPATESPALDLYDEAQALVQQGSKESWRKAVEKYEASIAMDEEFSASYTGLAFAQYLILQDQPQLLFASLDELIDLAAKAALLDPQSANPNALLAWLHFRVGWNFTEARKNFDLAIEKEPDKAQVHSQYSQFLLAMGEFDRALEELASTRRLNPSYYASPTAAWINNMQRRYDDAMLELQKLLEVRPNTLAYHISAQSILENMGKESESFVHLLRVMTLSGYESSTLERVKHIYDQEELAGVYRWLAFEKRETKNIGQYSPPLSYARYAAKAGEMEDALNYLEAALEKRQYELLWINVDPKYDALRDHPRFQRLVSSIGLDPTQTHRLESL